jgi:hypothetical protein
MSILGTVSATQRLHQTDYFPTFLESRRYHRRIYIL